MCDPLDGEDKGRLGAIKLLKQIADVANFSLNGSHGALATFDGTDSQTAQIQFNMNVTVDEFIKKSVDECLDKKDDNDPCRNFYKYPCACCGDTDIISGLNYSLKNIFNTTSGMRKETSKVAVLITDGRDSPWVPTNNNESYINMGLEYDEQDITLLVLGVGDVDDTKLKLLVQVPDFYFYASDWDELDAEFIKAIIAVLCGGNTLFL